MWNTALSVNSVLWIIASTFFIYAIGNAILTLTWKELLISFIFAAGLTITQIVAGALAD